MQTRLKNVEGSLLRFVGPPDILSIIVVLHLKFKFSRILPVGFVILARCIIFHGGKMLHFDNHSHSFLKILYFLYYIWDSLGEVKTICICFKVTSIL